MYHVAHDVLLHVISVRCVLRDFRPGYLSLRVGDSSWRSEETAPFNAISTITKPPNCERDYLGTNKRSRCPIYCLRLLNVTETRQRTKRQIKDLQNHCRVSVSKTCRITAEFPCQKSNKVKTVRDSNKQVLALVAVGVTVTAIVLVVEW